MSRVIPLCLVIAAACSAAGCQKSADSSAASAPGKAAPGDPRAGSADDQLMLDYLRLRNEMAELLEKKAPEAKIRDASERSGAKLRELQALPQDRQKAVQKKYQKEWDAAQARVGKAITGGQQ
jgi:hypothetical protein